MARRTARAAVARSARVASPRRRSRRTATTSSTSRTGSTRCDTTLGVESRSENTLPGRSSCTSTMATGAGTGRPARWAGTAAPPAAPPDEEPAIRAFAQAPRRVAEQQVGGRQVGEPLGHMADAVGTGSGTRSAPTATRSSRRRAAPRAKRSSPPREISVRPRPNMIPAPETNTGSETMPCVGGVSISARPTPTTVPGHTASETVNSLTGSAGRAVPTARPRRPRSWVGTARRAQCTSLCRHVLGAFMTGSRSGDVVRGSSAGGTCSPARRRVDRTRHRSSDVGDAGAAVPATMRV